MTEEIIIDGVNVAGCERRIGKNNFCRYFKCNCADNNYNCIWKKCLRLEQENKELKEIINKSARSFCNDYLKTFEENKFLNKQIMEVKFNAQQEIEFLTEEKNKYRSALEEIRKIILTYESKEWNCFNDMDVKLKEISKVINEVLGE